MGSLLIKKDESFNRTLEMIFSFIAKNFKDQNVLIVTENDLCYSLKLKDLTNFTLDCVDVFQERVDFRQYDIVIDSKHSENNFNNIYGKALTVYSFTEIYARALYQTTFDMLKKNSIHFIYFYAPVYSRKTVREVKTWADTRKDKRLLEALYDDNAECLNYALSEEANWGFANVSNGIHNVLPDVRGKYVNIVAGKRITTDRPSSSINSIYFFGPCTVRGGFVSDKYTIPSFVQRLINLELDSKYDVVNCGTNGGKQHLDYFEHIFNTPLNNGDIVVLIEFYNCLLEEIMQKNLINRYELSQLFASQDSEMWFIDNAWHPTHKGNKVIGEFIYQKIKPLIKDNCINERIVNFQDNSFENIRSSWLGNEQFMSYLKEIKLKVNDVPSSINIGSIVMNCNPFTLGHQYLIEQALRKVSFLYVFIVEEDRSYFSFQDRTEMLKRGTKQLQNVRIFPSGKWMISQFTFPEYFSKETKNNVIVTPSLDVNLFKVIASELNISARFVGEEPKDFITRQYNETLRKELYKSNIHFFEIPRKSIDGSVISASTVRELIKAGEYEELKKYIPESTYKYLSAHLFGKR